uniref:RRM domain-containing protein n=1 Tax=Panagrellus redivivus TaxID=6233 RepID=A0A7E4VBW7_PANRE
MSYRDRGDRDSYRNGGGGGGGDRPRGPPPAISGLHSLKVDNISYQTTQSELRRLFERYGEIGDVHIPRDRRSRQSRGFGFVRFTSRRDAEYAVTKMDGRHVDGRDIRVSFAKYDRPIDEGDRREGGGRRSRSPVRNRSRSRSPIRRRSRERSASPPKRSVSRSRSPIKRSPSRSRSRTP